MRRLLLLLLFTTECIYAQESVYRFRNFSAQDGLAEKYVYSVTRDQPGFLYFGTASGLYRYDGVQFELLRSSADQPGFSIGNILQAVYADSRDVIWLGSLNALQWYHPKTGTFTAPKDTGQAAIIRAAYPIHFVEDQQQRIWISTLHQGLWHFDRRDSSFHAHLNWFSERDSGTVLQVHPLPDGRIWLLRAHGLYLIHPERNQVDFFAAPATEFTAMILDAQRKGIWVTSLSQGLLFFDPATGQFQHQAAYNQVLKQHNLFSLAQRSDGKIWVGSYPLFLVDPTQEKVTMFPAENTVSRALVASRIVQIYPDQQQNWWMLSHFGLSMLPTDQGQVTELRLTHPRTNAPIEPTQLLELPNQSGFLLAGSNTPGLLRVDPRTGQQQVIPHPTQPSRAISILFTDAAGTIWANDEQELLRYDPTSNTLVTTTIRDDQGQPLGMLGRACVDSSGVCYIAAIHRGYYRWKLGGIPVLHRFAVVDPSLQSLPDQRILPTCTDRRGRVWFTARNGVYSYDPKTERYQAHLKQANGTIPALVDAHSMVEDQLGRIWITSRANGLFLLMSSASGVQYKHFNRNGSAGLPVDYLSRIRWNPLDSTLWINSLAGLIQFDPQRERVIRVVNASSGLESTDAYNFSLDQQAQLHVLFFGKMNSLSASLLPKHQSAKTYIRWTYGDRLGESVFGGHITDTATLVLQPDQSVWSVRFALLHYAYPEQHRFYSWLEGLEPTWTDLGNRRELRYAGLKSGTYRLHIRAVDAFGVPAANQLLFIVTIEKPLWLRTWFLLTCAGILIALGILAYRTRIRRIHREAAMKADFEQAMADVEMKALRAQMNPHFIFNSLNSIQNYILRKSPQEAATYLTRFARLIRLILDHSDQPYVFLSSELELLRLYIEMEQMRFEQAFEVRWEIDPAVRVDLIQVPAMLIQPYVENAIWHGLLHQSSRGELVIRIHMDATDERLLCVTIRDNGIGREASRKRQQERAHTRVSRGMHITAERIRLINQVNPTPARVQVRDLKHLTGEAAGTEVCLWLPISTQRPNSDYA